MSLYEGIIVTKNLKNATSIGIIRNDNEINKVFVKKIKNLNEYHVLKKVAHLDLAPKVLELRTEQDNHLLICEYIQGMTLKELLLNYRSPSDKFINVFKKKLMRAIDRLHEIGVIHGNIKPSNVIINDGIKLVNFHKATPYQEQSLVSDQNGLKECLWALENSLEYRERFKA